MGWLGSKPASPPNRNRITLGIRVRSRNSNTVIRGKKWLRRLPSNWPERIQHFLKFARGTARAQVVATEFLDQLFVAVDYAKAAFDTRLGRETSTAFTASLESRVG